MNDITVNKTDLLKSLTENRDRHQEIFEEACAGYQEQTEKLLKSHWDKVKQGKMVRISINLPFPENHTKDYDRVIKMIEMHTGNEFDISEHDFGMYVMDDWQWKRQFLVSNSGYSQTATDFLEQM